MRRTACRWRMETKGPMRRHGVHKRMTSNGREDALRRHRPHPVPRTVAAVILMFLAVGEAQAGNNASGSARLSWAVDSLLTYQHVPGHSSFPLYLQLQGVTDLQGLGVSLKWFPAPDSAYSGYQIGFDVPDDSCGWATSAAPENPFGGDT